MSLYARILALQERITNKEEQITRLEYMIRACQQSTGWEEAIEGAIIRRDRWLIELKAMKAEQHVQQHQQLAPAAPPLLADRYSAERGCTVTTAHPQFR